MERNKRKLLRGIVYLERQSVFQQLNEIVIPIEIHHMQCRLQID